MTRAWFYTAAALWVAGTQFGAAQNPTVLTWYPVASAAHRDSCMVIPDATRLHRVLADAGWDDEDIEAVDTTKHLLMVTASDPHSALDDVSLSEDGSHALVSFAYSDTRNSGAFLLVIGGSLGSRGNCGIERSSPPSPGSQTESATSLDSVQADQPVTRTTSTSTSSTTSAKPQ